VSVEEQEQFRGTVDARHRLTVPDQFAQELASAVVVYVAPSSQRRMGEVMGAW
jgi:DNA-binding transcriptional regulator/RsmH inhibitor MraZ